jgi:hypothetical protein
MTSTLDAIQPYVEQLFDDTDVQRQLRRASANLRVARARAGNQKTKKQALQDERLRHRLAEAIRASTAAAAGVKAGPEKQRRSNRRSGLVAMALIGAGVVVAYNDTARATLLGLFGWQDTPPAEA